MIRRFPLPALLIAMFVLASETALEAQQAPSALIISSRCLACHNNLKTAKGA